MVPPDLRRSGRNFSAGRMKNFSLAKNFAMRMKATPTGPSAFFTRACQLCCDGCAESVSIAVPSGAPFISQLPTILPLPQSSQRSAWSPSRGSREAAGEGLVRSSLDRWISQFVECAAEICEHVAREERFFALAFLEDRQLGRSPASPRADPAGIVKR